MMCIIKGGNFMLLMYQHKGASDHAQKLFQNMSWKCLIGILYHVFGCLIGTCPVQVSE